MSILSIYIIGLLLITNLVCIIFGFYYFHENKTIKYGKKQLEMLVQVILESCDAHIWHYHTKNNKFSTLFRNNFPFKNEGIETLAKLFEEPDQKQFLTIIEELKNGTRPNFSFVGKAKSPITREIIYIRLHMFAHMEKDKYLDIIGSYKELSKDFRTIDDGRKELRILQTAINAIYTGVTIFNSDGIFENINRAGLELYGIKDKEQFLSKHYCIFDNPNFKNLAINREIKKDIIDSIVKYDFEEVRKIDKERTSNTGSRYFINSFHPVKDTMGKLECIILATADITDNIKINYKYERLYSENLLLFESLPIGIAFFDKNGDKIYMNDTYLKILGMNREQIIGKTHNLYMNPNIQDEDKERIKQEDLVSFTVCIDFNQPENKIFYNSSFDIKKYYSVKCRRVKESEDEESRTIVIISDTTQAELQHRQIMSMNQNMNNLIKAGDLFAWTINIETGTREIIQGTKYLPTQSSTSEYIKYFHPEDAVVFNEVITNLKNQKIKKSRNILRYIDNDKEGGFAYLEIFTVAKKEDGKITNISCIGRDVTELSLSQQKLINSEARTALAFQGSEMTQYDYNVATNSLSVYHHDILLTGKTKVNLDEYKTLVHPEDLEKNAETIRRMQAGEDFVCNIAYREKLPESQEWYNTIATNIPMEKDSNGKVLIYTGIRRNNTQWDKLISNLEKSELLLQTIINRMPCVFFLKNADDDFRYILANDLFCSSLGKTSNEVIGHTDYELMATKEEADAYRKNDEEAMKLGISSVKEITEWKGEQHIWRTTKTPLEGVDGNRLLLAMSLETTSLDNAYNELLKEKIKAEQSDKLKSAFLANMSHEIRTPLNSIVGFADILVNTDDQEKKEEYGKIITNNSDSLLNIINDILDLSKIEAGYIDLFYEKTDLTEMFNSIYHSTMLRINSENVKLLCTCPYKHYEIGTDRNKLNQVMNNFLSNAIKYTKEGHIEFGYKKKDGGIKVYVKDTGIGISKDKQYRVFEQFEKLGSLVQGTGLGLSICKAIIEAMKGKVGFKSEEGKGSEFWAWIPDTEVNELSNIEDHRYSISEIGNN